MEQEAREEGRRRGGATESHIANASEHKQERIQSRLNEKRLLPQPHHQSLSAFPG